MQGTVVDDALRAVHRIIRGMIDLLHTIGCLTSLFVMSFSVMDCAMRLSCTHLLDLNYQTREALLTLESTQARGMLKLKTARAASCGIVAVWSCCKAASSGEQHASCLGGLLLCM
jgi:hypothetical protein